MTEQKKITLLEAVNLALHRAMVEDDNVVMLGEDIGVNGGVFRATQGLQVGTIDSAGTTTLNGAAAAGLGAGAGLLQDAAQRAARATAKARVDWVTRVRPPGRVHHTARAGEWRARAHLVPSAGGVTDRRRASTSARSQGAGRTCDEALVNGPQRGNPTPLTRRQRFRRPAPG